MCDLKKIVYPRSNEYKSGTDYEPFLFFLDALGESKSFDLLLGYFSSSALNVLSLGFTKFLLNGGKMRMIINNVLSSEDKKSLVEGSSKIGEEINDEVILLEKIKKLGESSKHTMECFAWLIANRRLEIIVIKPKNKSGISHYKSGIFSDGNNAVSFKGSCNFSANALLENLEEFEIKKQWNSDYESQSIECNRKYFEEIFNKESDFIDYVNVNDVEERIVREFGGSDINSLINNEQLLIKKKREAFKSNTLVRLRIEELSNEIRKIKDTPRFPYPTGAREYQKEAFENWKVNGQKGLFAMATGTGKTITSLNCLLEIYKKTGYYKAIILVPTITLLEQWVGECNKFKFNNVYKVYSKNRRWKNDIDTLQLQEQIGGKDEKVSYVIISTYASFARDNVFSVLNEFSKMRLLLIADEVHNMGSGQIRNKLQAVKYGRRIGLSATPERQYDDDGNRILLSFFKSIDKYTFEYSMEKAIEKGVLCKYLYYPHIVRLTMQEMKEYKELSLKIAKYANSEGEIKRSDSILTALLLKRKRIIHKAYNKKGVFERIVKNLYSANKNLKYTLVYVPEGNVPEEISDIYIDREEILEDNQSQHLIDQYSAIVRDVNSRVTVKQFVSSSKDRDRILDDFASGKLEVLTSMKCLDEGVDVPQSKVAIFCASTGNPRQFIQRRGRILRTYEGKHHAIIHDLVVVPEINQFKDSYKLERKMMNTELNRVRNFALLSENSSDTIDALNETFKYYNLSLF